MDSSFSSTGSNSSLHHIANRVNRFLSRKDRTQTPTSPTTTTRTVVSSSILGIHSCSSSKSVPHKVSPHKSKQNTYVIEGIHGPVTTKKAPIGVTPRKRDPKRNKQKFQKFIAAKQSERVRKLSMDLPHSPIHYPRRTNASPTSVIPVDSVTTSMDDTAPHQEDTEYSFISVHHKSSSPLKSAFNTHIGMIPKKKLTWWDNEENKDKPCVLRSDDLNDDCSETSLFRDQDVLFGHSGCAHDNFKDLFEDYSGRVRNTMKDLFHVKRMKDHLFRDTFVSCSEVYQ